MKVHQKDRVRIQNYLNKQEMKAEKNSTKASGINASYFRYITTIN